jgi:uncharacterized protein YacL
MDLNVSSEEARAALDTVQRGRQRVIDEIDLPWWYWWGLAAGWVALGVIADLNHPWVTIAATLIFGAAHAAVAPRVLNGRHRTTQLSVSAETAVPRTAGLVIGSLIALVVVTVVIALAVNADGAEHPATIASVFVAVLVVLGGLRLLAAVRRRAASRSER